jgi:hypothetical protein
MALVPTPSHERNAECYRKLYDSINTTCYQALTSQQEHDPAVHYTSNSMGKEFPLSHRATEHVHYALHHAWADSTIRKYTSSIKQFHIFCDREGVPHEYRLPASEFLLCSFAASDAGVLSGNTAQNRISAVRAWHITSNVHWHGDLRLNYVLNGVENLTPTNSRKPPCPPITKTMIELLDAHLNHTDTLDICILAAAKTAFWGQCRLAEIMSPTAMKLPERTRLLLTL